MVEKFDELDAEALYLGHGTVDGREAPKDADGLCLQDSHGACRRCNAERKLRELGFKRDPLVTGAVERSRLSKLLHQLADVL